MEPVKLSKTLMRRLPMYLEHLRSLPEEIRNISATAIADALGLGEVQVRKDLAKISCEGRCRTGRSRVQLIRDIERSLNSAYQTNAILVCDDPFFRNPAAEPGIRIAARFTLGSPPNGVGPGGCPVYPISRLESFCKFYHVDMGIIAVSADKAQAVCDGLIACGIMRLWNLSDTYLTVPSGIQLQHSQPHRDIC